MKTITCMIRSALLAAALGTVLSSQAAQPLPEGLQPVPDVPPPPMAADADLEPQVTIRQQDGDKVEEYRLHGKLYMVKVTPPHGVPYYLVDDVGNGTLVKRDTIGPNIKPPMWVIHSF